MTSLPKHRGQHGGLIALIVLAATITVVVFTQPEKPAPPPPPVARPQATLPAPRPPEPVPPPPAPPRDRTKITATGTVSFDGRRTHRVEVPVYGWLQKPRTSSIGRRIRAGETLAVIYSPEVYLTSAEVVDQVKNYASPEALDTARVRLLRWGMRKDQLVAIEQALKPTAELPLIARVSGTVVAEPVLATPLVDPTAGVELFTITDPTYAVIYIDMPVADVASLALGKTARVAIDGMARPVLAPIGYISRRVEDGTRTVRFDLHDPALRFTPGAKASLVIAR